MKKYNISKVKESAVTQTKISWKSTVEGKAYFDPNWALNLLNNKGRREKFTPSDEMVEWFMKSFADIDPLSLPETHEFSNGYYKGHIHGKYTIAALQMIIKVVFTSDVKETESIRLFNKYKHIINNKKMLFMMLIRMHQKNSSYVDIDELNNIAMQISLEERLRLSTFGLNSTISKDHNEYLTELNGEYTYVYRTFRVRKGESIRKGVTKQDNFDWTTHEEGKGCSYSLSKVRAISIAQWLHKSMLEKYGQASMEDMTRFIKLNYLSDTFDSPMQLQDDVYCAVGLFKIKKENVIGATNDMDEDEIITHPDNVELIDYKFLNILDFISQWFVWVTHESLTSNVSQLKDSNKTGFMNEEQFYDICYDYLSNNDEVDDDFLNDFICVYNNLPSHKKSKFYEKLRNKIFGDDSSLGIEIFSHQRTGDMKYHLGLGKKDGRKFSQKLNLSDSIRPRTGILKYINNAFC